MKIGFDAKRAFYNRAGLGNYSRNMIQYLTNSFPENQYFLFSPKISQSINFKGKEDSKIITPSSFLGKLAPSYWRSFLMNNDIDRENIELFHGLSNEIPKGINTSKTKSIVSIHDLIFLRFPELYKPIDRIIYDRKFRYACEHSDKIIAISEQTKKEIMHYYKITPDKIKVIYQACDPVYSESVSIEQKSLVREKYKLPQEFILNVGTIERRKNILSVIKALHHGKISIPLVIVGKQTVYMEEILDFVRKHKMEQQLIFLHKISFDELPSLYQMASLFVYPSIFEGFGIPVIEAINSKIPVITSNLSSLPEAGGKHSLYVEPYNIEQLAEAIKKVLDDPEKASEMVEKSLLYVQKFKGANIAKEVMNLYSSLL